MIRGRELSVICVVIRILGSLPLPVHTTIGCRARGWSCLTHIGHIGFITGSLDCPKMAMDVAPIIMDLSYEANVQVECCIHCFFCFLTDASETETHEREMVAGERSMQVRVTVTELSSDSDTEDFDEVPVASPIPARNVLNLTLK